MLTVLSVSFPLAPVSRDTVGGSEQVLCQLDAALEAAGHRSLVIACEGSSVRGALIATPQPMGSLEQARTAAQAAHRRAIEMALQRWPIDVIHMHGIDFHAYLPPPGVPTLVTLHGPFWWYPREALSPVRPETYLHCVSAAQRRTAPPGVNLLPDIQNGVDVDALGRRHARRNFALSLGRICHEKGFHLALDAARMARVPMLLAGAVYTYPEHQKHFWNDIVPRLDERRRFIGPLGFVRKRRFLAAARCLLVPSLVEETGSLVAMEALAAGTPVIAFPKGALSEVIEDGVTGFLVEGVEEMAAAIHKVGRIDPEACRAAARTRFSSTTMNEAYLRVYHELAGRQAAAACDRVA